MNIYIDSDYKCYINPADDRRQIETSFFDDKCDIFIEGYRFIPADDSWSDERGTVFTGEMAFPWRQYDKIDAIQREYERDQYHKANEEKAAYIASYAEGVNEA